MQKEELRAAIETELKIALSLVREGYRHPEDAGRHISEAGGLLRELVPGAGAFDDPSDSGYFLSKKRDHPVLGHETT